MFAIVFIFIGLIKKSYEEIISIVRPFIDGTCMGI